MRKFFTIIAVLLSVSVFGHGEGPAVVHFSVNGTDIMHKINTQSWSDTYVATVNNATPLNTVNFGTPQTLVFVYAQATGWGDWGSEHNPWTNPERAHWKCLQMSEKFKVFYRISKGVHHTAWTGFMLSSCEYITTTENNVWLYTEYGAVNKDLIAEARALDGDGTYTLEMAILYSDNSTTTTTPTSGIQTATFTIEPTIIEPCEDCGNDPCTCEGDIPDVCEDCGNDPCTCDGEQPLEPAITLSIDHTELVRNEKVNFHITAENTDSIAVFHNGVFLTSFAMGIENVFSQAIPFTPTQKGEHYLTAVAMNRFGLRVSDEIDFTVKDTVDATWRFATMPVSGNSYANNVPIQLVVSLFDADSAVLRLNNHTIIRRSYQEDGFAVHLPATMSVGEHTATLTAYGFRNSMVTLSKTFRIVQGTSNQLQIEDEGVRVYPNPVTDGILFVDGIVGARQASPLQVEIYNLSGKLVYTPFTIHYSPLTIDISHLPTGTYVLKVGERSVKIVKN